MSVPVAPGDMTWLLMDRPNNLMYVHGLLWFRQPPDWTKVEEVLTERLVDRFPVFGRRAAEVDGQWVWEDDPNFSLDNHVRRVTLESPGTRVEAQEYISSRFSEPFDPAHPLWEMDFIEGVSDIGEPGEGAMLLARFHHGIADGVRLVQVLLSMLDPLTDGAVPDAVGRKSKGGGVMGSMSRAMGQVVSGTTDLVSGLGSAVVKAPGWLAENGLQTISAGADVVRDPTMVTDALTSVASEENKLANTMRSVSRIALSRSSVDTVWSGTPGVAKTVTWISGLPLADAKRIGRQHGATINDVLLAVVSLGITDYLRQQGVTDLDKVHWLLPVSLKPIDSELPKDLGNHFALVMMPLPLGIDDVDVLMPEIHARMNRIKNSAEALVVYGIQRVIAQTPATVSVPLTNYVANKAVGVLTNVPGPRGPMALAGTEVEGILGWVPASGDQTLGLCIFSYNGTVNIGLAADAAVVPEPEALGEAIERAFYHLVGQTV